MDMICLWYLSYQPENMKEVFGQARLEAAPRVVGG